MAERKPGRPIDPNSERQRKLAKRAGRPVGVKAGRVEQALERSLATRHEIPDAERAALRTQARAIDAAEGEGDYDGVSRANNIYLDLRKAAGLSADGTKATDAWDHLLAEITRPTPSDSNAAD